MFLPWYFLNQYKTIVAFNENYAECDAIENIFTLLKLCLAEFIIMKQF